MQGKNNSGQLPPGFRFHPTDEELIMYYLRNQATSRPCPASIIPEVDIYKFDPWQLPVLCRIYRKRHSMRHLEEKTENTVLAHLDVTPATDAREQQMVKIPRTCSLSQLLELDYLGSISQLLSGDTYNSNFDSQNLMSDASTDHDTRGILEDDGFPGGTKVKARGLVTYAPYSMVRVEYDWGPDAVSFKPERWLKDGFFRNASPYRSTAFRASAGQRICLGKDRIFPNEDGTVPYCVDFSVLVFAPSHPLEDRMTTALSNLNWNMA
ncbi:hypothetical protein SADUNF_Sadunf10G0125800 [Salix dunnii]|uniref:NAC domain-containing protein n=1 Tax=Salix dunnii TaxID=1413687 RepID=A0A835JTL7_9ROSI|nr:hypothetical protein SADUNF_Sadunf10G0125800 [Salix dunnii]